MNNIWTWVVVVVVVGGIGYWLMQGRASTPSTVLPSSATTVGDTGAVTPPTAETAPAATATPDTSTNVAPMTATVSYDGKSFSPADVTVKKGGSVTFTSTVNTMNVASASHPAHTGYDGTDRSTHCAPGYTGVKPFDQCSSGTSYTFTFDKVGSWPYHDHRNASAYGKVIVVQ